MKTTIPLSHAGKRKIEVQTMKFCTGVHLSIFSPDPAPGREEHISLTPEQAATVIFGLERALEALQTRAEVQL